LNRWSARSVHYLVTLLVHLGRIKIYFFELKLVFSFPITLKCSVGEMKLFTFIRCER